MFESLGFETLTPRGASVYLALILGALFGLLAERTAFCLRRAVVGEDRRQAAGVWLMALAVAVAGTQAAAVAGLIDFGDHRLTTGSLPLLALVAGGLAFGTGMVLTRGCISRLTVLGAGGNLRAFFVLALFAIVAHATLKGALTPLRTVLSGFTVELGASANLATWAGGPLLWSAVIALPALAVALTSGNRPGRLILAAMIGALVPLGWIGTGYVLLDEFDPIAMESLSFIAPWTETLFWTIASTAIEPGFGTGLIGGVLVGALVSTLIAGRFRWQSFETPRQTGRYAAGAVLMGVGGVLAGGCTVGAGLAGVPTLGLSALIALASIVAGAALAARVLGEAGGTSALPVPAE
ncbi:YeeE/YedE family protein [Oceanicola sp. 22II-s10i]|uniref:YeeE/YedE family protein n=1 Tax=Oceanicola sp. 22II-s10i TaxID=1317116 RepID=UPI000B51F3CC|nr:YeeE/YedE family protein [Oceanicola sp. 22II-s10i]OWU83710.1 YeeE/YedE family protein [Oceanicola sp. 22II-s10i]